MASIEVFRDLQIGNGFQYFTDAVEATTIYEFEQLALPFYDELKMFMNFIAIQD
jgi:hypothetical protein